MGRLIPGGQRASGTAAVTLAAPAFSLLRFSPHEFTTAHGLMSSKLQFSHLIAQVLLFLGFLQHFIVRKICRPRISKRDACMTSQIRKMYRLFYYSMLWMLFPFWFELIFQNVCNYSCWKLLCLGSFISILCFWKQWPGRAYVRDLIFLFIHFM